MWRMCASLVAVAGLGSWVSWPTSLEQSAAREIAPSAGGRAGHAARTAPTAADRMVRPTHADAREDAATTAGTSSSSVPQSSETATPAPVVPTAQRKLVQAPESVSANRAAAVGLFDQIATQAHSLWRRIEPTVPTEERAMRPEIVHSRFEAARVQRSPAGQEPHMQPRPAVRAFASPAPPPELRKVEDWIGVWDRTIELVSPDLEDMRQTAPAGASERSSTTKGQSTIEWALGGMFLKEEGWDELPDGQRVHFVAFLAWDPRLERYRVWKFDDRGRHGDEWLRFDRDGTTVYAIMKVTDALGQTSRGTAKLTFPDQGVMEWTTRQSGPAGQTIFKGRMRRRK